jgi:hypothetical protein
MMVVSVVATLIEVAWGLGRKLRQWEQRPARGVTQHVGLLATAD